MDKRSRWPHTVVVQVVGRSSVRLACTGCKYKSEPMAEPTVSALTNEAWDHRRASR